MAEIAETSQIQFVHVGTMETDTDNPLRVLAVGNLLQPPGTSRFSHMKHAAGASLVVRSDQLLFTVVGCNVCGHNTGDDRAQRHQDEQRPKRKTEPTPRPHDWLGGALPFHLVTSANPLVHLKDSYLERSFISAAATHIRPIEPPRGG
jgi:hypothetical protein